MDFELQKSVYNLFGGFVIEENNFDYENILNTGYIFDQKLLKTIDMPKFLNWITKNNPTWNNTFQKNWDKVKNASDFQLYQEQIMHYFTTYGYENQGIAGEVYVPYGKIEKTNIQYKYIPGFDEPQIREKTIKLAKSGVALGEKSVLDLAKLVKYFDISVDDIKNKEVFCILCNDLNILPADPVEQVRLAVYKYTGKTLLIKSKEVIEQIKSKPQKIVLSDEVAQVFNRFKPLLLAMKKENVSLINKLSRLSKTQHIPMKQDILNNILSCKNIEELEKSLSKANIFRKIRVLQFLNYSNPEKLYKIRNGKMFAKMQPSNQNLNTILIKDYILKNILSDLTFLKGKKIFISKNIKYGLPSSEKSFTGNIPFGTKILVENNLLFGVHWFNTETKRIDIDLSLIAVEGKYGWDSSYRDENGEIMFSGDMTDAPRPKGASEIFYCKNGISQPALMVANIYNYKIEDDIELNVLVGQEKLDELPYSYMVKDVLLEAKTSATRPQKIMGLVVEDGFIFFEGDFGKSNISGSNKYIEIAKKYMYQYNSNYIYLNDLFQKAGAVLVDEKNECDIDLSAETLSKTKILNILDGNLD